MNRLVEMKSERRAMLARWVLADSVGIFCAHLGARLLAVGWLSGIRVVPSLAIEIFALLATTVFLLWLKGLYAIQAKYLNLRDIEGIFSIGVASAVLSWLLSLAAGDIPDSRVAVSVIYGLAFTPVLVGLRVLYQRLERSMRPTNDEHSKGAGARTILIGGGDAGEMVVREVQRMPFPSHRLVGIVDDDPRKSYTKIHGVPVIGATSEIAALVQKFEVDEILIAVPSADGETMRDLNALCMSTGARVRTLPAIRDLIAGKTVANQIRDIDISDLLRRPAVPADPAITEGLVRGQVILITGAGGSIGSELARQVARLSPAKLILVGKGENSIFEIEQQIVMDGFPVPVAIIADVRDVKSMAKVFAAHRPAVVFHAAAHKHVPLMESNPIEAIRNNVFGTANVVEASLAYGARKVILVSTDKAVHPGNVMGATKRVAELVVRSWTDGTQLDSVIVRFGNVLGSRGSLVPMLKAQIQRGGPVRITHPEMTRFFMTIPEAVQLITHAGSMGRSGETFILEMGQPIRILDLAKDLIRLHGLEPDETMPIVFTGIRPGEKLEEVLAYDSEELIATSHPKIRSALCTEKIDRPALRRELETLRDLCDRGLEDEARSALMRLATQGAETPKLSAAPGETVGSLR